MDSIMEIFTSYSIDIFTTAMTVIVTIVSVIITSKEFFKKFTKINKENIELQKVTYNIIVENDKASINNEKDIELTQSYRLKQDTLLELSEKRNVDKFFKKLSFSLAVIMSVTGTIILFIGIVLSLFFETKIGWITTSSGVIIEIVASVYFWLVNKTMKEVKENSQQLENTKNQITAMELVEKIEDSKTKDSVYVEMIKALIEK